MHRISVSVEELAGTCLRVCWVNWAFVLASVPRVRTRMRVKRGRMLEFRELRREIVRASTAVLVEGTMKASFWAVGREAIVRGGIS